MKIRITSFDVNEGEIVLHEPNEQDAIPIGRDEIPFISPEQVLDRPVAVFEVIANGYQNAYVSLELD